MNENDLARRIVSRLDQDLTKLPADILGRLADARARALHAPSRPVPLYVQLSEWVGSHRMMVKVALPALFLLVPAGPCEVTSAPGRPQATAPALLQGPQGASRGERARGLQRALRGHVGGARQAGVAWRGQRRSAQGHRSGRREQAALHAHTCDGRMR